MAATGHESLSPFDHVVRNSHVIGTCLPKSASEISLKVMFVALLLLVRYTHLSVIKRVARYMGVRKGVKTIHYEEMLGIRYSNCSLCKVFFNQGLGVYQV